MPSVGMRRSTRVFGLVKGVDGARVLRSGRKLWPDSGDAKLREGNDKDDWLKSMVDGDGGAGCDRGDYRGLVNGSRDDESKPNRDERDMDLSSEVGFPDKVDGGLTERDCKRGNYGGLDSGNTMFGVVYVRKRKGKGDVGVSSDWKRYGKSYYRRNKRQKKDITGGVVPRCGGITIVVQKRSSSASNVLSRFLCTVLKYMKMVDVRLSAMIMFFMSEPLRDVFLSQGVQFSQGSSFVLGAGFCKIIGSQEHCPIFYLDFSAIPACFMLMHCQMFLRCLFMPLAFVHISAIGQTVSSSVGLMDLEDCEDMECSPSGQSNTPPRVDVPVNVSVLHLPVNSLKVETRYSLCRHRTSRSIRRRRSPLRARRGKNHSFSGVSKCNGTLASDLVSAKKNGFPFSSVVSSKKIRRSMQTRLAGNVDEISSKISSLQDSESISCTANFLTLQSDQCLREEGVNIVLEASNLGECFLVGKKGGLTLFTYKALEVVKPCFASRLHHSTVWSGDNGWKLEFPNHDDWLKFKDLYRECFERNKQVASPLSSFTKIIPVPRVCEVSGYEEDHYATLLRPDSYIISKDELSRAMTSKGSCYDMDSEDEEWLKVYNSNSKLLEEGKLHERVSDESFEHMIDAFEKDFYYNPHDLSDEKPASHICTKMTNKDVLEAVYGYWTNKRKHRRSALVRVFQGYQPRKTPLIPKPVFRKRRSFKRQVSQQGRGKPTAFLQGSFQAMVAERDATEEEAAMHKVEEAREFANRLMEFAINKRQRAQFLTENADLAAYGAAMALRIAEAAQVTDAPDFAALHFLD